MYHKSHEYLMPVSPIAGATRRHGRWMILSSCLCFVFLGGGKSREKAEKKVEVCTMPCHRVVVAHGNYHPLDRGNGRYHGM
jgi:hypothetical protein